MPVYILLSRCALALWLVHCDGNNVNVCDVCCERTFTGIAIAVSCQEIVSALYNDQSVTTNICTLQCVHPTMIQSGYCKEALKGICLLMLCTLNPPEEPALHPFAALLHSPCLHSWFISYCTTPNIPASADYLVEMALFRLVIWCVPVHHPEAA